MSKNKIHSWICQKRIQKINFSWRVGIVNRQSKFVNFSFKIKKIILRKNHVAIHFLCFALIGLHTSSFRFVFPHRRNGEKMLHRGSARWDNSDWWVIVLTNWTSGLELTLSFDLQSITKLNSMIPVRMDSCPHRPTLECTSKFVTVTTRWFYRESTVRRDVFHLFRIHPASMLFVCTRTVRPGLVVHNCVSIWTFKSVNMPSIMPMSPRRRNSLNCNCASGSCSIRSNRLPRNKTTSVTGKNVSDTQARAQTREFYGGRWLRLQSLWLWASGKWDIWRVSSRRRNWSRFWAMRMRSQYPIFSFNFLHLYSLFTLPLFLLDFRPFFSSP